MPNRAEPTTIDQARRSDGHSPLVSIVIPNYNGKHLLDVCLQSLAAQSYSSIEIIVVDNASTDGSVEYIRQSYPWAKVVEHSRNLGFGAAINAGIEASRGEWIFALNNDTEVESRCVEKIVQASQSEPSLGMIATRILDFRQRDIIDVAGISVYPDCSSRGRGRLERDSERYHQREQVFAPSGAAGFYRREMLDEVGLFDSDFFMYCEDTDLAFRGRLAGWECVYEPEAIVYHLYSATAGKYSPLKAKLVERNRLWLAIKVLPTPLLVVSIGYTFLRYLYQAFGALRGVGASGQFVAEMSKLDLARALLGAYYEALRGLGKALRKRRQIQATRRVGLSRVWSWFVDYRISVSELTLKA